MLSDQGRRSGRRTRQPTPSAVPSALCRWLTNVPEGDTLRRAAEVLTPVLDGQVVTDLWFKKLRGYRPRVGDTIHSVEAVGKYLLIEFDRNLVLHTHLGMSGSWRTSGLDRPVPRDPKLRIVIETALGRALCFAAPDISTHIATSMWWLRTAGLARPTRPRLPNSCLISRSRPVSATCLRVKRSSSLACIRSFS
jgi:hypothetical protein